MLPFELLCRLLLFFAVTFGLAWPLASRLTLDPAEKLGATAALSLIGAWLIAWTTYVCALSPMVLWSLPALSVAGLAFGWRAGAALWRDDAARALIVGQLLVTGWCVGWLSFVTTYSGGGWAGDWFEHWERAQFFLERWPRDHLFLTSYPLPARPPLANVVTAAFLQLTRPDFAHFQLVSTLLGSLAFLPAGLLARRFGGGRASIAVLAFALMVNPMFMQNATFAWTKLPTAFFVLGALYFFLRAHDDSAPPAAAPLFAAGLAAALLTHYSAGPYAVMLVIGAIMPSRRRRLETSARKPLLLVAAVGAALLATWFGWSLAVYGPSATFLSNTTVTGNVADHGNRLLKILLNIRDTLVPHFLRTVDPKVVAQSNLWGTWRDWFFQLYQLNLLFVFGSVGWLVLGRELWRTGRVADPMWRRFWIVFTVGSVALGIAVHGERDVWGVAHVCLQSLVLLGLALLAARWSALGRGWQLALAAGQAIDFFTGIVLHFAVENYAPDRWWPDGRTLDQVMLSFTEAGRFNIIAKARNHLVFFSDVFTAPPALVLALLAAIFILALARARARAPSG